MSTDTRPLGTSRASRMYVTLCAVLDVPWEIEEAKCDGTLVARAIRGPLRLVVVHPLDGVTWAHSQIGTERGPIWQVPLDLEGTDTAHAVAVSAAALAEAYRGIVAMGAADLGLDLIEAGARPSVPVTAALGALAVAVSDHLRPPAGDAMWGLTADDDGDPHASIEVLGYTLRLGVSLAHPAQTRGWYLMVEHGGDEVHVAVHDDLSSAVEALRGWLVDEVEPVAHALGLTR